MVFKVSSNPGHSMILSFIKTSHMLPKRNTIIIRTKYKSSYRNHSSCCWCCTKTSPRLPEKNKLKLWTWLRENYLQKKTPNTILFGPNLIEGFSQWKCLPGFPPSPVIKNEAKTLYIPQKPNQIKNNLVLIYHWSTCNNQRDHNQFHSKDLSPPKHSFKWSRQTQVLS